MRWCAGVLTAVVLVSACGRDEAVVSEPGETVAPAPRYAVTTTVLESEAHGPELCLGGVATSLPPQCGGPAVVGWDWGAVDGEETAQTTTWGSYSLVGTWDGERFTLTEPPGPPDYPPPPKSDFSTPCDPPPGGWSVVDPALATHPAQDAAIAFARAQPDFAGAWVDQSMNEALQQDPTDEAAEKDPTQLVLNLRFTGDLARHEAEIRARWGGSVCLSQAERALDDLEAVQRTLHQEIELFGSSVDEVRGVVEVTVAVAEPELQRSLDERFGTGVVALTGLLRPVG